MKPIDKITGIRKDLEKMYGEDDPLTKAAKLKEMYLKIGAEFDRVRAFKNYEVSLEFICQKFHVSTGTAKRAIAHSNKVHENELTGD